MTNKKIKPPFSYFGNKGRFYKEIKEIFENNYRNNFVDLFAGAMIVPLNLKNEFSNLNVLANIKDEYLETFIKVDVLDIYKRGLEFIYPEWQTAINSRKLYDTNKIKFNEIKNKYNGIFNELCPCCGRKIKEKKESIFNEEERLVLSKLMSFCGNGENLGSQFYSKDKFKNLEIYLEKIKEIKITTEYFSENWKYQDSFIFLDPPYIQKTKADEEQNFIGYSYTNDHSAAEWTIKDDERLIEFIKGNLNGNNVFLIFGSKENNLYKLLKDNFNCKFIEKEYTKTMFGKVGKRLEWFCLIR
nr:MAG TPA: DNA adenine methylase [Caudoviricetes sp.]